MPSNEPDPTRINQPIRFSKSVLPIFRGSQVSRSGVTLGEMLLEAVYSGLEPLPPASASTTHSSTRGFRCVYLTSSARLTETASALAATATKGVAIPNPRLDEPSEVGNRGCDFPRVRLFGCCGRHTAGEPDLFREIVALVLRSAVGTALRRFQRGHACGVISCTGRL
jgi:hypothetical protein